MKRSAGAVLLASVIFLLLGATAGFGQARQPIAYVLSAGDKVVIVLGNVPRTLGGFTVTRKGPGDSSFTALTDQPVRLVDDPFVARQMMGSDFDWISRRVETVDPDTAWRRIRARPDLGAVLSLVSNGLRMALGRTYFDLEVIPGQIYTYRVVLLDSVGAEAGRIEKQVTVAPPRRPDTPGKVSATTGKSDVTITWSYPRYQGGDADLTAGFNVFRSEQGQPPVLLTPSPVLRVESQLQFIDSLPLLDTPVTYSVQAVDLIGTLSDPVGGPPVTFRDTTPPMAPQGVTAVDRKDGVLLVWKISPEARADHYVVYRSGREDSGYETVSGAPIPVSQPRFLDPKPVRGQAWYYKVSVVGRNGIESAMSAAAPIIPQKTAPPPAIQGLTYTVDPKKRSVSLSWTAMDEPDLKGYIIFRGESRDSMVRLTAKPLPPSPKPSWDDGGWQGSGLPSGKTLVYAVAAIDTSFNQGAPAFAEVAIPDTAPPAAAFSLSARSTADGRAALSWQPSLSRTLALHRVQRKAASADYATVAELPVKTVTWTDTTVEKGKTYSYRIIEVNSSGVESAPSPVATVTVTSTMPPAPPASLSAQLTPKGVSLAWQPSPSPDTRGYFVYRAPYKGAQFSRLTPKPLADTSWLDPNGTKDAVYAVSSLDASGNEGSRATAAVVVPDKGKTP
jgi:large repetitive protein